MSVAPKSRSMLEPRVLLRRVTCVSDPKVWNCLLIGFLILLTAWAAWPLRGTVVGDSVIHLVYARNLAHGLFFQYNVGEVSTGSSSPLWTALLGLLALLVPEILVPSAKLLALFLYLGSFWLVYLAARRAVCLSRGFATLAVLVWSAVSWRGLELALELFETLLAVDLVLLLFIVLPEVGRSAWWAAAAGIVAGLCPLGRMELAAFAGLSLGWLCIAAVMRRVPMRNAGIALLAAVLVGGPYFLWSLAATGHFLSSSALGRALSGSEEVSTSLRSLVVRIVALAAVSGGTASFWRHGPRSGRPAVLLAAGSFAFYHLFFTFAAPAGSHYGRYTFVAAPLAALVIVAGIAAIPAMVVRRWLTAAVAGSGVLFAMGGTFATRASETYPLDLIVEQRVCDWINANTPRSSKVLLYEVQARYCLDRRILALDGIIDARILPYAARRSDLVDFLLAERPDYWVANNAPRYRPYLARSIFRDVLENTPRVLGASYESQGIRFEVVKVRGPEEPTVQGQGPNPKYPLFAGYLAIYRIKYAPVVGVMEASRTWEPRVVSVPTH